MLQKDIYLITNRPEHFQELGWTKFAELYPTLTELSEHDSIQFDLETSGLNSFLVERIHSAQFGIPGKQFVVDIHTIPLTEFKQPLESKEIIGHKLLFDLPYVYKEGIVPRKIFDTFVTEWCLTKGLKPGPGRDKSLEACAKRYLNYIIDKSMQKNIADGLVSVEAIEYAGGDVVCLLDLKEAMMATAARRQLEHNVFFESRVINPIVYLEFSGVRVDKEMLDKWIRNNEADEIVAERILNERYGELNWSSVKQVGEKLKEFGIEHVNEETGNLMTDADVLSKYDIPIVHDLTNYRELSKMVSTYGRKWYSYILPDGRIHTKYKQLVDTGRTSCGQVDRRRMDPWDLNYSCREPYPNMQNPPKKRKGFREVFTAKPGNVLVISDYSGQESVILADQSRDEAMMALFGGEGRDPHSYVARLAYPELVNLSDEEIKSKFSDLRDICKTAAFAIAYGGNGKTIADNINCSVELGDYIYQTYMAAFPGLKPFFDQCYDFAWRRGYMQCDWVTGGKRFFDRAREYKEWKENKEYWNRYWDEKRRNSNWYEREKEKMAWFNAMTSELRKESVNTRIQGTGAVMSKLAMVYFFDWIYENGLFGKVLMPIFVHDEIVAECHKKSGDKIAEALQECMERAGAQCLRHLTIKAEPKISERWTK